MALGVGGLMNRKCCCGGVQCPPFINLLPRSVVYSNNSDFNFVPPLMHASHLNGFSASCTTTNTASVGGNTNVSLILEVRDSSGIPIGGFQTFKGGPAPITTSLTFETTSSAGGNVWNTQFASDFDSITIQGDLFPGLLPGPQGPDTDIGQIIIPECSAFRLNSDNIPTGGVDFTFDGTLAENQPP